VISDTIFTTDADGETSHTLVKNKQGTTQAVWSEAGEDFATELEMAVKHSVSKANIQNTVVIFKKPLPATETKPASYVKVQLKLTFNRADQTTPLDLNNAIANIISTVNSGDFKSRLYNQEV